MPHAHVFHQIVEPQPLGALAKARVERRHCRRELRRDAVVRRLVADGGGELCNSRAVVGGHVAAIGLALALPVPPVQVAPVVDHFSLGAQEIGVADVGGLDGTDAQFLARGLSQ